MLIRPDKTVSEEIEWLEKEVRPKRGQPERLLLRAIRQFVPMMVPGAFVVHIANEVTGNGQRGAPTHYQLRARFADGVVPGAPDDVVVLPGGAVRWWELKAPKGSVSPVQRELHARMAAMGHPVAIIRSLEDAELDLVAAGFTPNATARALCSRGGKVGRIAP